jgi:ABC-type amino acid transport substrate-binding protein
MLRSIGKLVPLAAFGVLVFGSVAPAIAADDIKAGSITNSPPMISYASDGTTLQGAIIDLAAAMSRQMGRTIVFESIPFKGLLPAMVAREAGVACLVLSHFVPSDSVADETWREAAARHYGGKIVIGSDLMVL